MLEHGLIDMVVARREIRDTLIRVISLLRQKTPDDLEKNNFSSKLNEETETNFSDLENEDKTVIG